MKEELLDVLKQKWPDAEIIQGKNWPEMNIPAAQLKDLAGFIKTDSRFAMDFMFNMTAVDWNEYFTCVYHFESTSLNHQLMIRARIDEHEQPEIDTLSDLWPASEFYEREVFDLFGIKFKNHPDPRRIFLDEEWEGHPLRKDYKDEINIIQR